MDIIISFFRDGIVGFWYILYILVCIFFIFVLLGIVGDRKRAFIAEKLKEKRKRDIESGEVARIAALESKQILNVLKDEHVNNDVQTTENSSTNEEVPAVLTIDSNSNTADGSASNN